MNTQAAYSPIAVVGMGCRFPGHVQTPAQFWQLLLDGEDVLEDVPADRWNQRYFHAADRAQPGSLISPRGGFLDDVAGFDYSFFGFSRLEAANIDPQQRLLLQVAWEALEQGRIPADQWKKKAVGVFMGCFTVDYHLMQFLDPLDIGAFATTGMMNTMLSNRLSYVFDFNGPSMSIDTACSASLTAVHQACQSLQSGESELALAGGSMLMLVPDYHIAETKTGMLSKDGRCKSFAAGANGYVRSEGVGVVALKRLDRAIADGDFIQAVLIGSAINQDGRTPTIATPAAEAQMAVMRRACERAGISPAQVTYVEAHGTGTSAGDPVEAAAIGAVYGRSSGRTQPVWVGSCKANIGHTEAASGIAGLIKSVLCVQHRQLPPHLYADTPNPRIPFESMGLQLPVQRQDLPPAAEPYIVGVNSFGFGGANAHVLVQEYPVAQPAPANPAANPLRLPLWAHTDKALRELALRYADALDHLAPERVGDFCANAATRRSTLARHRLFVGDDAADLIRQLRQFAQQPEPVVNGKASVASLEDVLGTTRSTEQAGTEMNSSPVPWMPLPTYPWQNEPLWQESARSRNRRLRPSVFAWLGSVVDEQTNQWEVLVSAEKTPWLTQHSIRGQCLLPGAVYIEMAMAALRYVAPTTQFAIEHLSFERAVVIKPGVAFLLRIQLDRPAQRFSISATASLSDRTHQPVASGQFRTLPPGSISQARWPADRPATEPAIDGETLYRFFEKGQFNYGPLFRGLKEVFLTEDESIGLVTLPAELASQLDDPAYVFHPVALDSLFHTLLALNYPNPTAFGLPVGVDRIRLFGRPTPYMQVRAKRTHETDSLVKLDLFFYDLAGAPLGYIEGFCAQKITAPRRDRLSVNAIYQSLLLPEWEPCSIASSTGVTDRHFVLLADQQGVGLRLKSRLEQAGFSVTVAQPGHTLNNGDTVDQLICLLDQQTADTLIINCLPLDAIDFSGSLQSVVQPLQALAKAIRQTNFTGQVWSISQLTQLVDGNEADIQVFQAGLWGIANVFCHQENRHNGGGIIDISTHSDTEQLAQLLTADALPETMLAIRHQQVFCKRLNRYPNKGTSADTVQFDPAATYVITGAFGALGKAVTQWAIEAGARQLLLTTSRVVSRTQNPDDDTWIQSLRKQGAAIDVACVDLTDTDSLTAFTASCVNRSVRGVLYCAGISHDQLLTEANDAVTQQVMATKVLGAYRLHEALLPVPLEHFVLFSSIGSFLPNRGLGVYAAANASLDALAHKRRLMGLPALSINWGPWSSGMTQKGNLEAFFAKMGMHSLSVAEGLATLSQVFHSPDAQLAVLPVDWPVFLNTSLTDHPLFANHRRSDSLALSGSNPFRQAETIASEVVSQLALLADLDVAQVDMTCSLPDCGIDSLTAMVFKDWLKRHLSIDLSIDDLLAAHDVRTLIDSLTVRYQDMQLA
ncbi:polyketide synthase [Fibrella aestuarina BUZ 2]|uniref:Polyketide synthase n=1 Tax=Fibrella aestuarina BUZ 2 TaxID=1166018 RepID=I0K2Q6_9BACT|nr:SDR family NAD(P)-dependent oxidoreductase [Fibrella aestuarina]CCG98409.1 polyketide synthase [Fibrella aestuarina BUZ 2]